MIQTMKNAIDYVAGAIDSFGGKTTNPRSPMWGVWWGVLLLLILAFAGQSSKFIYIDF